MDGPRLPNLRFIKEVLFETRYVKAPFEHDVHRSWSRLWLSARAGYKRIHPIFGTSARGKLLNLKFAGILNFFRIIFKNWASGPSPLNLVCEMPPKSAPKSCACRVKKVGTPLEYPACRVLQFRTWCAPSCVLGPRRPPPPLLSHRTPSFAKWKTNCSKLKPSQTKCFCPSAGPDSADLAGAGQVAGVTSCLPAVAMPW